MFRRIKELLYARKVCEKYGLKLKLIPSLGEQAWYDYVQKSVAINPFSRHFISSFLHEIGHHTHDKRVEYAQYLFISESTKRPCHCTNDRIVTKVLEAEAFASRFAIKTGKVDKQFLLKSFYTYTADFVSYASVLCGSNGLYETLIDTIYKCTRGISH